MPLEYDEVGGTWLLQNRAIAVITFAAVRSVPFSIPHWRAGKCSVGLGGVLLLEPL